MFGNTHEWITNDKNAHISTSKLLLSSEFMKVFEMNFRIRQYKCGRYINDYI
jgi:hypothetical protein